MTITRYWDLTPDERTLLTEQEVDDLCNLELMVQGIVKPKPLTLLPEDNPNVGTTEVYGIEAQSARYSWREALPIVFRTREDAKAFLRLSVNLVASDYGTPDHFLPLVEPKVISRKMASAGQVAERQSEVNRCRGIWEYLYQRVKYERSRHP